MKQYKKLVEDIFKNGTLKNDRTGTGVLSIFGNLSRYDLQEGFPLLTTKKVNFDAIVKELLWIIRGSTNINDGLDSKIWDEWADEKGDLGPIYGYQWRKWERYIPLGNNKYKIEYIDQLKNAIETIKKNPDSRRIIVNAWNVSDLNKMKLPPCHSLFQFYVCENKLHCTLYQRSADVAIGVPFNIASYALLQTMIANECELIPGVFIHTIGDAHIYSNHIEKLMEQMKRKPRTLPKVEIAKKPFFDVKFEDIELRNYDPHPPIKFDISV